MSNKLFFICPCDYLESEIKSRFRGHHYFYTGLGNNYIFNHKSLDQIHLLLKERNISKIVFIANYRNKFYVDTINEEYHASVNIKSVRKVYSNLKKLINPLVFHQYKAEIQLKILASFNLLNQTNKLIDAYKTIYKTDDFEHEAFIFDEKLNKFEKINKYRLITACSAN